MIEFTIGGAWFRWDTLDRQAKWLAGSSMSGASVAGFLAGIWFAYGLHGGTTSQLDIAIRPYVAWVAWCVVSLLVLSAVLWWRFSLRQDEMFNKVQNWALGYTSFWTMAVVTIWAILALAGAAPPVSIGAILLMYWAALMAFWFVAVRRWA